MSDDKRRTDGGMRDHSDRVHADLLALVETDVQPGDRDREAAECVADIAAIAAARAEGYERGRAEREALRERMFDLIHGAVSAVVLNAPRCRRCQAAMGPWLHSCTSRPGGDAMSDRPTTPDAEALPRCGATIWPPWSDRWIQCPGRIKRGRCTAYGSQHTAALADPEAGR